MRVKALLCCSEAPTLETKAFGRVHVGRLGRRFESALLSSCSLVAHINTHQLGGDRDCESREKRWPCQLATQELVGVQGHLAASWEKNMAVIDSGEAAGSTEVNSDGVTVARSRPSQPRMRPQK